MCWNPFFIKSYVPKSTGLDCNEFNAIGFSWEALRSEFHKYSMISHDCLFSNDLTGNKPKIPEYCWQVYDIGSITPEHFAKDDWTSMDDFLSKESSVTRDKRTVSNGYLSVDQ